MDIELRDAAPGDHEEMRDIFNYYVENTSATYTETPVGPEMFDSLMCFNQDYPALIVRDDDGSMAGFGVLRPYSRIPAFDGTAELSIFLRAGYTGMGIGTMILDVLEDRAREMEIRSILATVSSLNEESVRFHIARGFSMQGRLEGIGRRRGRTFDVVLLLKMLD
ncbi:MAG TPA: GNAT family N-acetyltransferase [Chlorobaculum sp.]|nr:GNAT family N-acetyltransferase [Chlorobaculum sp.]